MCTSLVPLPAPGGCGLHVGGASAGRGLSSSRAGGSWKTLNFWLEPYSKGPPGFGYLNSPGQNHRHLHSSLTVDGDPNRQIFA